MCAPNGFVEVSLAPGQGGTRADGERMREYGNSWQAYSRGAENGMLLVEATTFADEAWRAEDTNREDTGADSGTNAVSSPTEVSCTCFVMKTGRGRWV